MILNINKPPSITSHDVVDIVRRHSKERRVGHGGTLDPFAEGVLVIGVGRDSTKKLGSILKGTEKEYIATLLLGKTSSTGDPEGKITPVHINYDIIDIKKISSTLELFCGEVSQTPPPYSALKVRGVRAYKLARLGKDVSLPKRVVNIYEIKLIEYSPPTLIIRIVCSSGTYIRVLAEDIAKKLGTGAYLTKLVRTRVGSHRIEKSVELDDLKDIFTETL